jgi:hypothetical protein
LLREQSTAELATTARHCRISSIHATRLICGITSKYPNVRPVTFQQGVPTVCAAPAANGKRTGMKSQICFAAPIAI